MKHILILLYIITFSNSLQANECIKHINVAEEEFNIPDGLMHSISRIESRRHQYALNVDGKSYFPKNKEEALTIIEKANTNNIDVGCMQINIKYHPDITAYDLLDADTNVTYAANFLSNLKNRYNSWPEAIARYHSGNEERQYIYQVLVFNEWKKLE